ncbi:uncharacterized protein PHALS_01237 [Plasmopara halstedii]|uniref:Uncharacterized protein n=1 Tax=Plasmopara halstedii TaxID=4781 RepID=A0A0P1AUT2_PLAHL|nr:uncharacterized protein PHALS_01237 [Plasmopara halstedii]CEG44910.1 hypothetical protein PHALS_01237 [Plasmopara halstedii]|eukprot:XP_024581279.1 hypothetical protein PHALS_01237 [Plasmopara halstedii]
MHDPEEINLSNVEKKKRSSAKQLRCFEDVVIMEKRISQRAVMTKPRVVGCDDRV